MTDRENLAALAIAGVAAGASAGVAKAAHEEAINAAEVAKTTYDEAIKAAEVADAAYVAADAAFERRPQRRSVLTLRLKCRRKHRSTCVHADPSDCTGITAQSLADATGQVVEVRDCAGDLFDRATPCESG